MSAPDAAKKMLDGSDETRLLIAESPYQFLPSLALMFGDTGALILQQLHYVLRHPYFEGERLPTTWYKGHFWIRIEAWMWYDDLEGFCRHLAQRTFERQKTQLENEKVLLTTSELNDYPGDNTNWFAINYSELQRLEREFRTDYQQRKKEREEQRNSLKVASGGTRHWRPKSRVVASRQNGDSLPPVIEMPERESTDANSVTPSRHFGGTLSPKWRPAKRQDGDPQNAKVADSTSTTEISLDISQTTTGEPVGSADVGEKSFDFLEPESLAADCEKPQGVETQTVAPSANETKAEGVTISEAAPSNAQAPLPGVAAIMSETGAPRETADLAQRFITYAEEFGFEVAAAQAVRIVGKSEWAKAKKPQLENLLKKEYSKLGFKTAIAGDARRDMLNDIDRLRFHVFLWPGHVQNLKSEKKEYDLSHPRYFIFRWGTHIPLGQWVQSLIQHDNVQQQGARDKDAARLAEEFWASLDERQRAAFELELKPNLQKNGSFYARGTAEYSKTRVRCLLDDEIRARVLAASDAIHAPAAQGDAPQLAESASIEEFEPHPNVASRCLKLYLPPILKSLQNGEIEEADVTTECAKISGLSLQEAAWLENQILTLWAQEKAA